MKALITGASGLVGHALERELKFAPGYDVVVTPRPNIDLCDFAATRAFFVDARPEIVFHIAAKVGGLGGNIAAPGQFFYENVVINTNVIEAARLAGARKIVAMGSSACYSDSVPLPMSERAIWDGPPHGSEAPYAHAKRAMLAQLEAYNVQYGLDYAFCLATNMFGPFDKYDEQHGHVVPTLISKFHRAVGSGERIVVWGTGTPTRDFLYSKDVARFLRVIGASYTGSINLASGATVTIRELVEMLRRVSGYKGVIEWDQTKPNGQELRRYDISKLKALRLAPKFDLETALDETYRWYEENIESVRR